MHDLNNILIELIFVLLHFFLFLLNFTLMNKRIMHPAVLFSGIWFFIILLHFIFSFTLLDQIFPLSITVFLIFFIGTICFTFGSFAATVLEQKTEKSTFTHPQLARGQQSISLTLRYILLAVIIIGLPFYIQATFRVFLASNIENFFVGLRTELSYGDEQIGPLIYLSSFSFVVYSINIYAFFKEKNEKNKILLITSLIVTLVFAVLSTGRTFFLMMLIVYMGISFIYKKNISIKKYAWFLSIFILFFISIGIFYGKGGDKESSIKGNIYPSTQMIAIYLVSSLDALDWELHHNFETHYSGDNTLRFFQKIGEKINLESNAKLVDKFEEFVFVPYPTNVYTFYSPYLRDFGKYYAWFMLMFFGFIHTVLYEKAARTKSIRHSLYYSFLLYPLIMSFFHDPYMSLFSQWLQMAIYVESIIFLNKFFVSKK